MSEQEFKDHLYNVMSLIPEFFQALSNEDFMVRTDLKKIYVDCSDIFLWGCADAEEINDADDLELLRQSLKDVTDIDKSCPWGPALYAARKRQERPQGAFYKYLDVYDYKKDQPREFNEEATAKMHKLFNDAGPERETGFGNPYKQGE